MSRVVSVVWQRFRTIDPALAAVLGLAAALRWTYIGMYQLVVDETSVLVAALRLARAGQWTWRATNTTNWTFLPYHSPLAVYLAAIPYVFSPDPRVVRMWVALLGIVAVGLAYWAVRRSFGRPAALLAGLLLAAHVPLVDWSRYSWNANYAQPFIAAWLLTALAGYHEMKDRMQTWHWLALSGAIQTHPATLVLAPLSALLVGMAWLRHRPARPTLLRATLLGWLLAALSLVPWGIGLLTGDIRPFTSNVSGGAVADVLQPAFTFDFGDLEWKFSSVVGSVGRRLNPAMYNQNGLFVASEGPGEWWPPAWIENVFRLQVGLSLAAMLFLLARGVWRGLHLPSLLLPLLGLFPFIIFRFSPTPRIEPWYLIAPVFGAVTALGVVLAQGAARWRGLRVPIFALVGVFVVGQVWLTAATMRNHALAGVVGRFDAPLDNYLAALDTWQAAGNGREVIIFAETEEGKRVPYVQKAYWDVASAGRPVRVVSMIPKQGVPVPARGAVFAGTPGGETIPALFGPGQMLGTLPNGEPMYRWVLVPSPPSRPLNLYPENLSKFTNGARLLGLGYDTPPQASQDWPVTLLWQVEDAPPPDQFSYSVRLADYSGRIFGQVDGGALDPDLWRVGDVVINRFTLPVNTDYPTGTIPRVQLWMYGAEPAAVEDEAGAAVAPFITLAPVNFGDQMAWFHFGAYGAHTALTAHPYLARLNSAVELLSFSATGLETRPGTTLPLTLYWSADQIPKTDYRVFVHLLAPDGTLVAQSDKVNPADVPLTHWAEDHYMIDRHQIVLPPDLPPGTYRLVVGLWDEATGQRASAVDGDGQPLGDSVPLPVTVEITP